MSAKKDFIVSYIGLGLAGGPLAENVFRNGFKTLVPHAYEQRQREFVAKTKTFFEAPAGTDGCKEVGLVRTMVPNGHVVRDILLAPQAIELF